MQTNRILTKYELNYVANKLKNARKQIFWILFTVVLFVSIVAVFVYTSKEANNIVINIGFGILILLIGALHWIFKGYKTHQIDPIVHKGVGYYQRVYEQRGKYGTYYDTINGIKIKMPWHWRRYMKKQKEEIHYEYIIRDGAVAINEFPIYVISINDKLSLDYELKNGLQKAKPLSLINIVSLFLLLPAVLLLSFESNFNNITEL